MSKSKVLFTQNITPESLVNIYRKLVRELKGKIAVKVHSGEPGGNNYTMILPMAWGLLF